MPQLFARTELQAVQAAPPLPHWDGVTRVTHVAPLQQPFGHVVASQTHWPETQRPVEHAGPKPHRQEPLSQLSAERASQAVHAEPKDPHCCVVTAVMQVVP